MLEAFEVDAAAEAVYLQMLRSPQAGVSELAGDLGMTGDAVRRALDQLAELSLLRPSWEDPSALRPVSPEVGLESLLAHRQVELMREQHRIDEGRAAMALVVANLAGTRPETAHADVEELIGIDAIRERLEQLTVETRHEVLAFMNGGRHSAASLDAGRPLDRQLLERGVSIRTITLDSVRNDPPTFGYAQWLTDLGGQVRSVPVLPLRMTIIDRERVMIPLDPGNSRAGAALLCGSGAVAAMCALFEQTWNTATPLGVAPPRSEAGLSNQEIALLRLLAQGDTDEVIARKLAVSVRTVRRICAELMAQLGARSRFQAGVRAAERGWLAVRPSAPPRSRPDDAAAS
ncbi:MAG TPA: helix-turn-helix transcriptional regulator [Streptosporangiaceae bacterium]|jgi:DNA-binding CsgD family transcriptional regulator